MGQDHLALYVTTFVGSAPSMFLWLCAGICEAAWIHGVGLDWLDANR